MRNILAIIVFVPGMVVKLKNYQNFSPMKNRIMILSLLAILHLSGFAQKIYFKGQVGYDFGFLKTQTNLTSENITTTNDSIFQTNSYQSYQNSYASGLTFNIGLGFMFTDYLGIELTGFYTSCRQQKFESQFKMKDELGYNVSGNYHYILKGTYYGLKPSLNFTLPGKDFRPYARIGAILGITKLQEKMDLYVFTDSPNYLPWAGMEYTLVYKSKFTAGVNFCLGLEYKFLKRFWLFAEVEGNVLYYLPASATFTSYIVNQQDITGTLSVHDREFQFVSNYSDNDNLSAGEPTKTLPVRYSFSSIGVNLGLKFTLFD